VRVIWVAMTLIVGIGILLYLILWLVMPLESPAQPLG
jgi:phage shock protein PspC (stress-responsive transcriptional regulator)